MPSYSPRLAQNVDEGEISYQLSWRVQVIIITIWVAGRLYRYVDISSRKDLYER